MPEGTKGFNIHPVDENLAPFVAEEALASLDLLALLHTNTTSRQLDVNYACHPTSFLTDIPFLIVHRHAFAGGCLMALAHDYRVMRSDRGFMCMVTNPLFIFGSPLSEHPRPKKKIFIHTDTPHFLLDLLERDRSPSTSASRHVGFAPLQVAPSCLPLSRP